MIATNEEHLLKTDTNEMGNPKCEWRVPFMFEVQGHDARKLKRLFERPSDSVDNPMPSGTVVHMSDFRSWCMEIVAAMETHPSTKPSAEVQIKVQYDQWLWHSMYLDSMSVADVLEWAEEKIDYLTWQEANAVQGFERVAPLRCEDVNCEGGGE